MSGSDREFDQQAIDEVAGYWLVRLASPDCTPQDRVAFEKWKRESLEHEEAYERLRLGNSIMDELLCEPELLALAEEARAQTRPPFWRQRVVQFSGIAASVIVAAGLAGLVLRQDPIPPQEPAVAETTLIAYETAIGERSTVTLEDGSQVTLNTDSRIEVRYSGQERLIDLTKGQGFFVVAKETHRPFVVEAGDKRVIALGTVFDVRYKTDVAVEVTLVEGRVDVDLIQPDKATGTPELAETTNIQTVSLQPGDRLLANTNLETPPEIVQPNISDETSWTTGKLVFRDKALIDVVAELNRYSTQKIVLGEDPRIADLEVSGVFTSGRASTFVTALETMHPLAGERTGRHEVTLVWSE